MTDLRDQAELTQADPTPPAGAPDEPPPSAPRLKELVEAQDSVGIAALIDAHPPSRRLRTFLKLAPGERDKVLALLPPELGASLIDDAPNELAVDLVERLEVETAASIIDELDSDVQADVIGELPEKDAEAILAEMDAEDAADVRRLAAYEADTAGGLMLAEAFTFRETDTVGEVLHRFVTADDDFERYRGQHPYVVDAEGRPVGVVSLRALLTAGRMRKLSEIMVAPLTVSADTRLHVLQDLFAEHPFFGLPVVDDGRLVGVVSRSAVDEAALERADAERRKVQGLVGDELRSMRLVIRLRRRLAWLSGNIALNVLAASVIAAYEETLAAVIAIAIFLPMVSDMSGCSGNQAVAVSLRELALGLVRPVDALRVWLKEVSVGAINGVVLGLLIAIVASAWKGNPWLGVVIGLALALNTVISVSVGGTVPLLVKRLNQDPAIASGPILTTITDIAGFFLVLSLATAVMPLLAR